MTSSKTFDLQFSTATATAVSAGAVVAPAVIRFEEANYVDCYYYDSVTG